MKISLNKMGEICQNKLPSNITTIQLLNVNLRYQNNCKYQAFLQESQESAVEWETFPNCLHFLYLLKTC